MVCGVNANPTLGIYYTSNPTYGIGLHKVKYASGSMQGGPKGAKLETPKPRVGWDSWKGTASLSAIVKSYS